MTIPSHNLFSFLLLAWSALSLLSPTPFPLQTQYLSLDLRKARAWTKDKGKYKLLSQKLSFPQALTASKQFWT